MPKKEKRKKENTWTSIFISALLTIAKKWKQPINRWMDKETVVHTYNGIWLSHKKEDNRVNCSEADEPRVYHTGWSQSERNKQISYINEYIWNLEKRTDEPFLLGRNGDTKVENRFVDAEGKGERGTHWESKSHMYTLLYGIDRQLVGSCRVAQGTQLRALWWLTGAGRGVVGGRFKRDRDISAPITFILLNSRNQHNIIKKL